MLLKALYIFYPNFSSLINIYYIYNLSVYKLLDLFYGSQCQYMWSVHICVLCN